MDPTELRPVCLRRPESPPIFFRKLSFSSMTRIRPLSLGKKDLSIALFIKKTFLIQLLGQIVSHESWRENE